MTGWTLTSECSASSLWPATNRSSSMKDTTENTEFLSSSSLTTGSAFTLDVSEKSSPSQFIPARTSNLQSESAKKVLDELNQLRFDRLEPLYGRDNEIEALHLVYDGMRKGNDAEQPISMVTVAGLSGTGKSAIAQEFQRQITERDKAAFFISGKFDQHQRSLPYHAFITAFTQLVSKFSALPTADTEELQHAIRRNYCVLLDLIPNLEDLFPEDEEETVSTASLPPDQKTYDVLLSQARFKFALSKFLSCVCQPRHKVIMFLDDLQWIDPASLDLLEFILLEPGLEDSLLIIGSYRNNEVNDEHKVQQRLASVEKSRGQQIRRLRIEGLTLENTHDLITDLFNVDPSCTKELAEIAHKRVKGNAFFLIQFLIALRDERHVSFNIGTGMWNWDVTTIRKCTVISDNVVAMLMEKMKKLEYNSRRMLTIISFLGSSFEETVVDMIATELADSSLLPAAVINESTNDTLESLVDAGFLEVIHDKEETGTRSSMRRKSSSRMDSCGEILTTMTTKRIYYFAHDQIQLAATSFQDGRVLPELKLKIARVLYSKRSNFDFEMMFFTVVDMYNQGRRFLKSEEEVSLLIDLNYQAGQSALESSAFIASTTYLRIAIDLIPPEDRWEKRYSLFLELQNLLIKAEYSNGEWDRLDKEIDTIINAKGKPVLDKITAYSMNITKLTYREKKHEEAIDLTVNLLQNLGITFRPRLGKFAVLGGLIKTKKLLKKIPMDTILKEQKQLVDLEREVGIDLLHALRPSLYASNKDFLITSVLKIMRWSLKYGICDHTPRSLGIYGLLEIAMGNVKSATEASDIAVELAEERNLMESKYSPIFTAYGYIYPWTKPLSSCAKQLMRGYKIGLEAGDQHRGFMNIVIYGFFSFSLGKPMSTLASDLGNYVKQMEECEIELPRSFLCLTWQVALNLLGDCENPLSMDGEAMTEQDIILSAMRDNNRPLRAQFFCHKLQLCVYFGDFELAATLLSETQKIGILNPAHPIIWRTALFEGVVAFELLRRGIKKYKSVGTKSIRNIQKFVSNGNPNCVHILYLLQAEKEAAHGNVNKAQRLYDKSIVHAARVGSVNDRALANERCAEMLLRKKKVFWGTIYFQQAKAAYLETEAYGKIDHMVKSYWPKIDLGGSKFLTSDSSETHRSS